MHSLPPRTRLASLTAVATDDNVMCANVSAAAGDGASATTAFTPLCILGNSFRDYEERSAFDPVFNTAARAPLNTVALFADLLLWVARPCGSASTCCVRLRCARSNPSMTRRSLGPGCSTTQPSTASRPSQRMNGNKSIMSLYLG